jgi:hypothetical protein
VVNQLSNSAGRGTAYEGIDTASATKNVSLPLLMNANSGYFTGVQCANLGGSTANMTMTFSAYNGFTPTAVTASVGNGASVTWLQNTIGQKYIGSGTVVSDQNVVCIANELNNDIAGDAFLTYNGINFQ